MKDYIPNHPLQAQAWGEFRKKTGIKVIQRRNFQITIHKIPHTPWTIGYIPKGPLPNKEMILELKRIGRQERCIFIQLEPNVQINSHPELVSGSQMLKQDGYQTGQYHSARPSPEPTGSGTVTRQVQHDKLVSSFHPLFTKYTFILDLTKTEEELLKNMHPKTRYNIKVAQKHGVKVIEDNSDEAFETYLKLTAETTRRQGFYAHTEKYHRLMWETLRIQKSEFRNQKIDNNKLTAHLFLAQFRPLTSDLRPLILAAWILFVYKDALYYPYGASSTLHRETMASNLMMWEAIKFGKRLGLKKFDMWGALGPNPSKNDPWYGFHRFKEGYGPILTEFVGSFDLTINALLYEIYKILDKVRWTLLKINPFDKLRINAEQSRSIKK